MLSSFTTTLIMAAVSGVLMGLGVFIRPLRRFFGVLTLLWMAAALPILFFRNIPSQNVLLFYTLSAVLCMICHFGGKPHDI